MVGIDDLVSIDPDRIRDKCRLSLDHLKKPHHVENPFDVPDSGDLIGPPEIPRFRGDSGLGMEYRSVSHVF